MKKSLRVLISLFIAFQISISFSAEDDTELEGISITGNQELPNTLNIVPWRTTETLSGFNVTLPELTGHRKLEPIIRAEFIREIEYHYWLNPQSELESVQNLSE